MGKCRSAFCNPETDRSNCTHLRFMQSSYLNVDMGLFLKFNTVSTSGRPTGCKGLSNNKWLQNKRRNSGPHGCPLNDAIDESGLKIHEIVQLFADDLQVWINEFVAVFQKMQENGYVAGSLASAPSNWQGLRCNNRACCRSP